MATAAAAFASLASETKRMRNGNSPLKNQRNYMIIDEIAKNHNAFYYTILN